MCSHATAKAQDGKGGGGVRLCAQEGEASKNKAHGACQVSSHGLAGGAANVDADGPP